jgi:putative oxidoreductase
MNCEKGCCQNGKSLDWALLVLRLAAGVIFVMHGYGKLFGDAPGMTAFTGMVAGMGFPLPGLFAYAAALSEFLGGLALILGIFTRYASIFLGVVMLVAFVGAKKFALPAGDVDLALLAMVVAIYLAGSGRCTVQKYMSKNKENCEECAHHDANHKH